MRCSILLPTPNRDIKPAPDIQIIPPSSYKPAYRSPRQRAIADIAFCILLALTLYCFNYSKGAAASTAQAAHSGDKLASSATIAPAAKPSPKPGQAASVASLTYCASVEEGLNEYAKWLKMPNVRELDDVIRRFGGEMVAPGQRIVVQEAVSDLTLVRTPTTNNLCYVETRFLRP